MWVKRTRANNYMILCVCSAWEHSNWQRTSGDRKTTVFIVAEGNFKERIHSDSSTQKRHYLQCGQMISLDRCTAWNLIWSAESTHILTHIHHLWCWCLAVMDCHEEAAGRQGRSLASVTCKVFAHVCQAANQRPAVTTVTPQPSSAHRETVTRCEYYV